jgi:RimJ/RimL family protein N-acetyltransferase
MAEANVRLSDGVVTLSPLVLDDVAAHLAGEDDELERWLSGGSSTRDGVEDYVRECQRRWASGGWPMYNFGVRYGADEVLVGTIDVQFELAFLEVGQANLAYGIYPAWRRRGIATRAVRLACEHALSVGASEVVIRVDPDNPASAAVARRAGFAYFERRVDGGETLDWYRLERVGRDVTA